MIEIMEHCHQYVPIKVVDGDTQHRHFAQRLLMGGDQLTCERARNSQRHRRDAALAEERLEALEPVVEDWHTEMCLFEVTNIHFRMHNNQIVVVCTTTHLAVKLLSLSIISSYTVAWGLQICKYYAQNYCLHLFNIVCR